VYLDACGDVLLWSDPMLWVRALFFSGVRGMGAHGSTVVWSRVGFACTGLELVSRENSRECGQAAVKDNSRGD